MALRRNEDQHPHIPFAKEPGIEPPRRGKRAIGSRATPPADRRQHGQAINEQLVASLDVILRARTIAGIDPARLIVLEFGSLGFELDEAFVERFGAQIVDEREERVGKARRYRAVLQFESVEAIQRFQREITAYQADDPRTQLLAHGQRRDFLDGLQGIRGLTRDDRLGDRLRSEGWPQVEPFMLDVDLWHPGEPQRAREIVQQLREFCQRSGGRVVDDLRTSSLLLLKVQCGRELGEMLLDLDLVSRVDLPPLVSAVFSNLSDPACHRRLWEPERRGWVYRRKCVVCREWDGLATGLRQRQSLSQLRDKLDKSWLVGSYCNGSTPAMPNC